jgi:XTP/dITP diphosphohydrolase
MKEVLLASNNQHKFQELSAILAHLPIKLVRPSELGLELDPPENGSTYLENALLKAKAFYEATGLPSLADDSGLEVQLLGGEPGLHSRRYLPKPGATDQERCLFLLSKLAGKPKPWLAAFHCHAVFYLKTDLIGEHHGTVTGEIIDEFRGFDGFGYDPIFWIPQEGKTMAELTSERKNQISHRARAFAELELLRDWVMGKKFSKKF